MFPDPEKSRSFGNAIASPVPLENSDPEGPAPCPTVLYIVPATYWVYLSYEHIDDAEAPLADALEKQVAKILDAPPGLDEIRMLWFGKEVHTIHVIAPKSQQETEFASIKSPNYDRFHKFGDKTAVWETLVLLAKLYPGADVRVHVAGEFDLESEMRLDNLAVIGGPGFGDDGNHVCRTISQRIESVVSYEDYETMLVGTTKLKASSKNHRMTQDYGYFARLRNPYNPDSVIVMAHGIHTLGVLGAARAFTVDAACRDNIESTLDELGSDPFFESCFPVSVTNGLVDVPAMRTATISPFSDHDGPPQHALYKCGRIPTMDEMMYPLLELSSGGKAKTVAELAGKMSDWLDLSAKQRQVRTKGGRIKIKSDVGFASDHLRRAGLLDKEQRGKHGRIRYKITPKGERMVSNPDISELTRTYMSQNCPSYYTYGKSA